MAVVTLDRVWLTAAADLSDSITFVTADRDDQRDRKGEVREYAGGRLRLITRPGETRTLPLRAVNVTTAQVEWLDTHAGLMLLLRDKKGRRVWGSYLPRREVDHPAQTGQDVVLTFLRLSYDESV